VINNVGPGGHYLYEDHTMKWFRKHYVPGLMERRSYEDWAVDSKTMRQRIVEKTQDIIENHEGPASTFPADVKEEWDRILQSAEEEVSK
jgi:trimethylamine--corrinoid protein Co-methyltransferase